MDLLDKAKILYRLDYLTANTNGLERILVCLISKSILTIEEEEIIKNQPTTLQKYEKLYILITRKGPDAFKQLSNTLISTGNKDVVQVLLQDLTDEETSRLNSDQELRNQIWFDMYEPTPHFCGRADELQQLFDYSSEQRKLVDKFKNITVIAGLGGIGKTELARTFAGEFYRNSPYGHCIWIHGESDSELSSGFKRLAGSKGIEVSLIDWEGKERLLSDLVVDIFTRLGCKKSCLVIDNVEEYKDLLQEVIEAITRLRPGLIRPFIVLTTRNKKLLTSAKLILLNELSEEAGIEFVKKSLESSEHSPPFDSELALELCKKFQFFPLALSQAVSYIVVQNELSLDVNNTNFGIQDYLNLYELNRASLLNYFPTIKQVHSYTQSTFLTWNITLGKIRQNLRLGNVAETLLTIISFFSPDSIQVEFLRQVFKSFITEFSNQRLNSDDENLAPAPNILASFFEKIHGFWRKSEDSATNNSEVVMSKQIVQIPSIVDINNAIHLINRYSVFHLSRGEIRIHRLVQEVIKLTFSEELTYQYLDILLHVFDTSSDERETRRMGLHYDVEKVVHVKSIWFHSKQIKDRIQLVRKYILIPGDIFFILHHSIRYDEAYLFCTGALNILESTFGSNHPITIDMEHNLGVILQKRGENIKSLDILKKVLEKRIKVYGIRSIRTTITRVEYALVLMKIGKHEDALTELSAIHIAMCSRLGPSHPSTLRVKNNIALVLNKQEKFKEALEILKEIYSLQREQLGELDPDALVAKNNIGFTLQHLQQYNEAYCIHQYVYEMKEKVYGQCHHETLKAKNDVVSNLNSLGKYQEALSLSEEVTSTAEQVLGPTHINTLSYKNTFGVLLIRVLKYDEAVKIFESLLDSFDEVGIMDNTLKFEILLNLAFVFNKINKCTEALEILTGECHEVVQKENFYHHKSCILSMKGLIALTLNNLSKFSEALELYKEVYEGQLNSLGEMGRTTLSIKHNMAVTIINMGNLEEGLKTLKDVWLARKTILGDDHLATLKYFEELKRLNISP